MCFSKGRFCKRHTSNRTQNPDVGEWLKPIKSDKHGTGPLPPTLPVLSVTKPKSIVMKESLGATSPTIAIESPDNLRIELNANGVKDSLSTALVDTPVGEVGRKAEKVKSIICEVQKSKDGQDEESVDAHLVNLDVSAESATANVAEKSIVEAAEETADPEEIATRNFDATRSDDLTTHVASGVGQENEEGKAESETFSCFNGDFTRDDGNEDSSKSNPATPEISDQWVECAKEVEGTEAERAAAEATETGAAKVSLKEVDITSLDPGPVFDFSDIGEVEMPDSALFHDMYADSIWSGSVVTRNPGILLARSRDYRRYGLEPPGDCIKDEEDTPELTYTVDGVPRAPGRFGRYIRLREWKTHNDSQSYYPTLQSTPSYDSRGKKLDRSGGGRY
ncbi:unnamed protein product [Tuber melanosporum]|uniref:(Perigord truffle) hypothetical protein n=1 Tax=Tuber melanosporum (strain Mel28) TaxID=656061 RepID=D5G880_TUBMM|nr:uncharacterized protein GSTUM_00002923001 [Tuber melanosporum]CAZ80723.1 unnamed protein product [Tuber melanosporum]